MFGGLPVTAAWPSEASAFTVPVLGVLDADHQQRQVGIVDALGNQALAWGDHSASLRALSSMKPAEPDRDT